MTVSPGDKFRPSARDWNKMLGAADRPPEGSAPRARVERDTGTLVLVKNSSGAHRDRFSILGIDAPTVLPTQNLDEFKNEIVLSCSTPDTDEHTAFAILQEGVPIGGLGLAIVAGASIVLLNVTSTGDVTAGLTDGNASWLTTGLPGATIIWKEDGTGLKRAIVAIGSPANEPVLVKTDAYHASGANGTVSIWTGAPGSETDSGDNLTAYNRFGDLPSGRFCWAENNGNGWHLTMRAQGLLGKTDLAINKGSGGSCSIWAGTPGSESDTGENVTAVNKFANIASGKWVWLHYNGDGWYCTAAECA